MNRAHKIAVFGKDVYILYVTEMPQDSRLLLLLWNPHIFLYWDRNHALIHPLKVNITRNQRS